MNKKEKLNLILKQVEENDLTAYQIAKFSKSSTLAIQNILNSTTKNPTEATLNDILQAIEKTITGANSDNKSDDYTKSVERELIETQKQLLESQKKQIELLEEKITNLQSDKSSFTEARK